MKFDIKDPESKKYAVYCNGELQTFAIEADDVVGYVRLNVIDNYWSASNKYKTLYGRIQIIRMDEYPIETYRDKLIIEKYYEPPKNDYGYRT
jgi:hypothetical protein